jgi:hypothetical protein
MKTINLLLFSLFIQISTLNATSDIAETVILRSNTAQTQTYSVPVGKTATIRSVRLASQGGVLTINGVLIASSAETGPQELALPMIISSGNAITVSRTVGSTVDSSAVIEVRDATAGIEGAVPLNAVVIPENTSGTFVVILESSTDMITWLPAVPGQYGSDTARRFFRTRIARQ